MTIFRAPMNLCPVVVLPLCMPPYWKGMISLSAMARIHLMGRANRTVGSSQNMFLGKTSFRIEAGRSSARISRVLPPGSETSAQA